LLSVHMESNLQKYSPKYICMCKNLFARYTCNSIWSVIKMPLKRKAGQKWGVAWSDHETRLREQNTLSLYTNNRSIRITW
jgi:hypothetical protein